MFSKELEALIQATLEDGVLEEHEKLALMRRAQSEGVDLVELEIYINSILQKRKRELDTKKEAEYAAIEKQKKQEFGKTCPACGRQVPSLALVCECGYEFKNDRHESSVKILSDKIESIQRQETKNGLLGKMPVTEGEKNNQIVSAITMFPVPNTKEDIMDFLALAAPNSKKKGGLWGSIPGRLMILGTIIGIISVFVLIIEPLSMIFVILFGAVPVIFACIAGQDIIYYNKRADAWRAKFDQVLMKGRSLRADEDFTKMLNYYERQVNRD